MPTKVRTRKKLPPERMCQVVGHAWEMSDQDPPDAFRHYKHLMAFHCPRCDTHRFDAWNYAGHMERRYEYADRYKELNRTLREAGDEGTSFRWQARTLLVDSIQ